MNAAACEAAAGEGMRMCSRCTDRAIEALEVVTIAMPLPTPARIATTIETTATKVAAQSDDARAARLVVYERLGEMSPEFWRDWLARPAVERVINDGARMGKEERDYFTPWFGHACSIREGARRACPLDREGLLARVSPQ